MAGYLTHVMVLIKAEAWLGDLIAGLDRRRTAPGACLSDFEEAMLDLARRSRSLLRVDPASAQRLPATQIENGVGSNLSRYALVGSIGMDFPINGHVLALNRDWVSRTMRLGSPRRAYVNADSTLFVLNFINALNDSSLALDPEQQRAMRSYALGHFAGVAADVVLQPAINSWTWSSQNTDNLDQHRFKVQLDARVAHGFFQRDNLHQGQSWEEYFLSSSDFERESEKLSKVFLKAFRDTFAGTRPTDGICALAASECRAPEITEGFIKDSYANTKNWAIGRGYDQSPWSWYKPVLGGLVVVGGLVAVLLAWGSTSSYNLEKWREGKGFETERLWFDLIATANTVAGPIYYPFTYLAKFPILWSGIFGQGLISTTDRPTGKAFLSIFKSILDNLSLVFDIILLFAGKTDANGAFYTSVDPVVNEPYVRWPRFGVSTVLELLKTFWIDKGSAENGEEGDRLAFTMFWPVKVATFGTFFASLLIVFGAKSARHNADGTTEDESSGWDYLIGLICPAVFIGITWGTRFFEGKVLEDIVGAPWPSTDTSAVDRFLPEASNGHRSFTATGATGFPVSLFEESNEGVVTAGAVPRYAEDADVSPWGTVRQRDDAARKVKSRESTVADYKMAELIDHAAHLAGLLAMAAVNYEGANPRLRDSVKEIFKDWNLDYRTVEEWNALLLQPSGADRGLLTATAEWWDDLSHNRTTTAPEVLTRIEQEMAVTGFSGRILADFTHTGARPQSIVSPLPPEARCGRLKRPGAVLLPNLNIDASIAVPLPSTLPDRRPLLDAVKDNAIESLSDEIELTEFRLERPTRAAASAYELILKIHHEDAQRVRVFEVNNADPPPAWPRRLGADSGGAHTESYILAGAGGGEVDFAVEALTLAGDPSLHAPTVAPPLGRDGVTPVAPARMASDVWMELVHRDGGAELPNLNEAALFTIAPWLLLSNLQPAERVYVSYYDDGSNHATVADLIDGLIAAMPAGQVAFRTTPHPDGGIRFTPHEPLPSAEANAAKGLYIVDAVKYPDQWVQDEFEIGYCWAPHGWMQVALHNPRSADTADQLGGFVIRELPSAEMALYDGVGAGATDSVDFGGNLEVSPPVAVATPRLPVSQGGPEVPAHEPAPFGKILLGEGKVLAFETDVSMASDLDFGGTVSGVVLGKFAAEAIALDPSSTVTVITAGSEWLITDPLDAMDPFTGELIHQRKQFSIKREGPGLKVFYLRLVSANYKAFLEAQRVQPLLLLDTSWLEVGHVDEYLSFIPANTGTNFRLLFASTQVALTLLDKARALHNLDTVAHPLSEMFRGVVWARIPEISGGLGAGTRYAAIDVDTVLTNATDFNTKLQTLKLTPIETRLKEGLNLTDSDVIHVPVIFDTLASGTFAQLGTIIDLGGQDATVRTVAFTPGMVNMLVVGSHAMVPKPFGPRMLTADVVSILTDMGLPGVTTARVAPLEGHWMWIGKGIPATLLETVFSISAASIRSHANNAGKFDSGGKVRKHQDKIWIPENTVDLFEAYFQLVLEDIGVTVHWVDDWYKYHILDGEVHCGTNAVRLPPEAAVGYSGPHWWDAYHP